MTENASRAFLDAVRKSMRQIRSVVGATIINPALFTAAERLQYDGFLRREETNASIQALLNVNQRAILGLTQFWWCRGSLRADHPRLQ